MTTIVFDQCLTGQEQHICTGRNLKGGSLALLLLLVLGMAFPATLHAQAAGSAVPELLDWRYGEDWSYLSDPAAQTNSWWEFLKYKQLGPGSYFNAGLEVRLRTINFESNAWGSAAAADDRYLLRRILPHVDIHAGENVRLFGQLIGADARGINPAPGSSDETGLDIAQAFGELRLALGDSDTAVVRTGRQLLSYGSERLISTRYGANVPLPFDGGVAILETLGWRLDGFYARPVQVGVHSFDDSSSRHRHLWGIYGARSQLSSVPGSIDTYYIGYANEAASYDRGSGKEQRHTFGVRLWGDQASWNWNWEAMYQSGSFATSQISAWALATETTYRLDSTALQPLVRLRANIASGDEGPANRSLGTFNALFPKVRFGELTPVGPYNLIHLNPSVHFDLGQGFVLNVATAWYWRQSTSDGIYGVSGNLIRSSNGSLARHIGTQLETGISWLPTPNFELQVSYSRMSAGRFIRETGPARAIHMTGMEGSFRF